MTVAVDRVRFDYAEVIARAIGVLHRNWPLLATLTLLFYGLPKLGATFLDLGADGLPLVGPVLASIRGIYSLVALLGFFAVQAMVVYVFAKDLDGRTATLAGALRHGVNLLAPVLCLSVALAAGIALGLVLLVIPGLMLATAWMVAIPAAAIERTGVKAALGRSAALTRGYRWEVFGILALLLLIGCALRFNHVDPPSIPFAVALVETVSHGLRALFEDLVAIVGALAFALVSSSIYCELRLLKEGVSPDELAAELD